MWNGKPQLLIGDSVTQGWMECGENFDQRGYVDALAARGINLLMIWAFKGTSAEIQQGDVRIGYDAPELWPWTGSPDKRSVELREFDPAYFARLRELVSYAGSKQIVVLITVHDGWPKTCFEGHPFNRALGNGPLADRRDYVDLADYDREMPEQFDPGWNWREKNQYFQERFCARLIAELTPCSNVLYEMFNEGEWYDRQKRDRHEQHFLAFFRARCDNLLLSNSDHIASDDPHTDPKLDVVTLHPKDWVGHFPVFERGFRKMPPKPYLYSEPVPEFDGETPSLDDVRRSVWETALAGAGWVNQNDPSFGWDSRTTIAAQAAARDRAYNVAGHCARFFNQGEARFWDMEPSGKLASTGVCLAHVGKEYVVYSASGGSLTVDLSAERNATLEVRWYNPRNGQFQESPAVVGGNRATRLTPPFRGDAVVHLRCANP
ncbi:MAG TPA: putative collagen-binding domain-containing protein [Thermoguttaceae bacterium]|nr:putative collagen-binding domain-containing protein [Thermoguttaceae bacterium]